MHTRDREPPPGSATPAERRGTVAVHADREFGFRFNCHPGALVAPDGTVDWLRSLVRDAPKSPEKADGPYRAIPRSPG
jgi:hypothetical protein